MDKPDEIRQSVWDWSEPTLCTLDEGGDPLPIWRWTSLPYWKVKELEDKRSEREAAKAFS